MLLPILALVPIEGLKRMGTPLGVGRLNFCFWGRSLGLSDVLCLVVLKACLRLGIEPARLLGL